MKRKGTGNRSETLILNKILGDPEVFSVQDRSLNALLISSFLISFLLFITDFLQQHGWRVFLYPLIMTVSFGVLYYYGRRKPCYRKMIIPFFIVNLSPVFYVWYFLDGISGPSFFFLISFFLILPIITEGYLRYLLVGIVIIITGFLFYFEWHNPDIVSNYHDFREEIVDTYITTIFVGIGIFIVTSLIIYSFRLQQDKIENLNKTKDKFFSIIAHDLKGPLIGMMQLGELLKLKQDELEEAKKNIIVNSIYENSKNTYNLLDNLLQWARSESNMLIANPVIIDLRAITEKNLAFLDQRLIDKNIRAEINFNGEFRVFADKNMFNTIIRNILSNAIKFTNPGGKISISADEFPGEKSVCLCIKDNGIGIKAENLNKIFDLKSAYRSRGTDKEKGTGLGLKLCKEFIEKNNGRIIAESSEGEGSTFKIIIPLA